MEVDLYEERKEVTADVERRLDVVHIYGVDLLSTKDILNYFHQLSRRTIQPPSVSSVFSSSRSSLNDAKL